MRLHLHVWLSYRYENPLMTSKEWLELKGSGSRVCTHKLQPELSQEGETIS